MHVVRRDPRAMGVELSRWTLDAIVSVCDWLKLETPSGLWKLMNRLGITYKRGRQHIMSPDPDYEAKLAYIEDIADSVRASEGDEVLLYLDEVTCYRDPSVARCYESRGKTQAYAEMGRGSNKDVPVLGTVDMMDGRVIYTQRDSIDVEALIEFYRRIDHIYSNASRIYVVQDNRPVHCHANIFAALEPQEYPWPFYRPVNWSDIPAQSAVDRWGHLHLPIQIVPLPTYASWANPIEKLWRKLKQELIHMHRYADRISELKEMICRFLDQFDQGSMELLRYVGLFIPD